jgi:biopolymer transport protein ExbB/TolQ
MLVTRLSRAVLRSPLLWGTLTTVGFYLLIYAKVLDGEAVFRYFNSHPVENISMLLFFVASAALLIKGCDALGQTPNADEWLLEPRRGAQPISDCPRLLQQLEELPAGRRESLLAARLRNGLEHITRADSAEKLDAELRFLADQEADRAHAGYALVRIVIWAIPILGFLGTVMGITIAIANISPEALEKSMPQVTAGLAVAFDTTALALALSMVLMFGQFLVDRAESRLLAAVERQAMLELSGRFEQTETGGDPQVAAVRRMAEAVLQATHKLAQRQAELLQATIDAAHQRWSQLTAASQQQFETTLSGALGKGLQQHAQQLAAAEKSAAENHRQQWADAVSTLAESTKAIRSQHQELVQQGVVLRQVVEATGQVARLEDTLNHNLAALAGSQHLEETLLNVSAALQLLTARLGQIPGGSPHLDLKREPKIGQAA